MRVAPRVLIVIPARGGSKGVPRKNLRRLGGRPLIAHAIEMARASVHRPAVVVTSDDDEILSVANSLGVDTLRRPKVLATDDMTLDSVVHDAHRRISEQSEGPFDLIVTVQPTSPLTRTRSLDKAIERLLKDAALDTIISATDDTHLRWVRHGDRFIPDYKERLNRQFLPLTYRETGGFLVTRAQHVTPDSRIGPAVSLEVVDGPEAIDIDTVQDFMLCEWHLSLRRVVFVVAGHPDIGLGHVHNALILAGELVRHDIRFIVPSGHQLAVETLQTHNYPVSQQRSADLAVDVLALEPDVVVNDLLDTDESYVRALKSGGATVINFEDLGEGARHADLVVNAIYPERQFLPNHYFGHRYFCARNEFLVGGPTKVRDDVRRVLLTFGGTDPGNLTGLVLDAIGRFCGQRGIEIDVILGRGYDHVRPHTTSNVAVHDGVGNISDFMRRADVVFTSAGRTVFEVACVGTPAIIMAQNTREMTHLFASEANGFLHLGMGEECEPELILRAFADLVENTESRRTMHSLMLQGDMRGGRERVVSLLENAIMNA